MKSESSDPKPELLGGREVARIFPPQAQEAAAKFLRDGVHAVAIGEDLALIDLRADAYLCIPGGARGTHGEIGAAMSFSRATAAALCQAGLCDQQAREIIRSLPTLPTRTIIHDSPPKLSLGHWLKGLAAVGDLRRAVRKKGLCSILAVAPARRPAENSQSVVDAAKAFWRIAPWLPIEGECLVRSALLMSYLRRCGLSADWVFGVRLWPFAAHCWVQIDDVCLNDDLERLAAYTPIYCR